MTKYFVLDTNVLLHNPLSIYSFDDNVVVIPIYVIEEIDNFKKEQSQLGRNARAISRILDDLRRKGNLSTGISLNENGTLIIKTTAVELSSEYVATDRGADSKILAVATELFQQGKNTTLVTKDTNLRIRAAALGISAEDYNSDKLDLSEFYSGVSKREVSPEIIDEFFSNGEVEIDTTELPENSFIVMSDGNQKSAMGRVNKDNGIITPLVARGVWGINAKNKEQSFALDLLLDDSIKLITITGLSGSGKTLIALAAGMQQVIEEKKYSKLLVTRPTLPIGKDLGFLPGEAEDKLRPWMQPIYDSLEFLLGAGRTSKRKREDNDFFGLEKIQVEPLTYIRGRSIPKQFILLDEAQNMTRHEVKALVTRAGEGTKIVMTGDIEQIDNPYIDSNSNGLSFLIKRFSGKRMYGHITLKKGERSELAELASKIL